MNAVDVLGSGRVARLVVSLLADRHPWLAIRLVTSRDVLRLPARDPATLARGPRTPLVIATSIDERRWLAQLPEAQRTRMALADPNLRWVMNRLPPGALAGRLVIVVTNPVEPIVDALARLEPSARVVGFGLAVDRARFVEVIARGLGVTEASLSAVRAAGTHATGAVPLLGGVERAILTAPAAFVARLRGYHSPYASRPLDDRLLDTVLSTAELAPRSCRAAVLVDIPARALAVAEHIDGAPPALRGAVELARMLSKLIGEAAVSDDRRAELRAWAVSESVLLPETAAKTPRRQGSIGIKRARSNPVAANARSMHCWIDGGLWLL